MELILIVLGGYPQYYIRSNAAADTGDILSISDLISSNEHLIPLEMPARVVQGTVRHSVCCTVHFGSDSRGSGDSKGSRDSTMPYCCLPKECSGCGITMTADALPPIGAVTYCIV